MKIVWSSEIKGEAEAANAGLIDRVLWLFPLQRNEFKEMCRGVPSTMVGNYIDLDDFHWKEAAQQNIYNWPVVTVRSGEFSAKLSQFLRVVRVG